jgi:hypothetical protein
MFLIVHHAGISHQRKYSVTGEWKIMQGHFFGEKKIQNAFTVVIVVLDFKF